MPFVIGVRLLTLSLKTSIRLPNHSLYFLFINYYATISQLFHGYDLLLDEKSLCVNFSPIFSCLEIIANRKENVVIMLSNISLEDSS